MTKLNIKIMLILLSVFHTACNRDAVRVMDVPKSICLNVSSVELVTPVAPYNELTTNYDYPSYRSFSIENNVLQLNDESQSDLIDSMRLVIIISFRNEGIHSGRSTSDMFVTGFPFTFDYASIFWRLKSKPFRITIDSINDNGEIYCKHREIRNVLKPGNYFILRDTMYDTITNSSAGENNMLYVNQYIKTDSIFNYGYLPLEKKP